MNPRSTDCEADAITTTPSRRYKTAYTVIRKWACDTDEHLRRHRLTQLVHLERMNAKSLTRRVREKTFEGNMGRGLKKTWKETMKDSIE